MVYRTTTTTTITISGRGRQWRQSPKQPPKYRQNYSYLVPRTSYQVWYVLCHAFFAPKVDEAEDRAETKQGVQHERERERERESARSSKYTTAACMQTWCISITRGITYRSLTLHCAAVQKPKSGSIIPSVFPPWRRCSLRIIVNCSEKKVLYGAKLGPWCAEARGVLH